MRPLSALLNPLWLALSRPHGFQALVLVGRKLAEIAELLPASCRDIDFPEDELPLDHRARPTANLKFDRNPSGLLLALAALGLAVTIWSLWDLSGHATRMAAIQNAATLADSVAAFRELSTNWVLEEHAHLPGTRSTRAPMLREDNPREESRAFIERLQSGAIGAIVTLHGRQDPLGSSPGTPDLESSFLSVARSHIRNAPGQPYYDFQLGSPNPLLRYVIEDPTVPNWDAEDPNEPSIGGLIEVSMRLDPNLIVDAEADVNQGLQLFTFLGVLWFSVASIALTASRRASQAALELAKEKAEDNLNLENLIRQREAAERETRRLEERVFASQRTESLNLITGGLAHDFNNLLVPILANADFLKAEVPADSPAREMLDDIDLAASRAADVCTQMLAYAGKSSPDCSRTDLNDIVNDIRQNLQIDSLGKLFVETSVAEGSLFTECDSRQISQALLNLIANASEAIGDKSGKIIVRTGSFQTTLDENFFQESENPGEAEAPTLLSPAIKQDRRIFFEVIDNGCGISQQNLDKIFDPFYSTKFAGRGLGLAVVQGIVNSHSGSIKVESEVGLYTRFRVELPQFDTEGLKPSHVDSARELEESGRKPGTILLADDEPTVRAVAQRILEQSGFKVISVSNGLEATERFSAEPGAFDACVFDLTMPTKDGDEALKEIRALNPTIPAVLISGYSEKIDEVAATCEAQTTFVHKPFRATALRRSLLEVLNWESHEPGPRENPVSARPAPGARSDAGGSNGSVAPAL
ncbi:MAG: response regulator [Myxococcota bacterium]|nr:response regulator [Myxococcota bacterium]